MSSVFSHATLNHMTSYNTRIQVSTDYETWKEVACRSSSVTPGGGDRGQGQIHDFCSDSPRIGIGRLEPVTLDINLIYTEEETEGFDLLEGFFKNRTEIYMRYRPKEQDGGSWQFVGSGFMTTVLPPEADATSADLLQTTVTWYGAELVLQTAAT